MTRKCILGCKYKEGTTYHIFPKDEQQKGRWLTFIRKIVPNYEIRNRRDSLCSQHFHEEEFLESMSYDLAREMGLNIGSHKRLKRGVVPSILPGNNETQSVRYVIHTLVETDPLADIGEVDGRVEDAVGSVVHDEGCQQATSSSECKFYIQSATDSTLVSYGELNHLGGGSDIKCELQDRKPEICDELATWLQSDNSQINSTGQKVSSQSRKSTSCQTKHKTKDVGTKCDYRIGVANASTQCLLMNTKSTVLGENVISWIHNLPKNVQSDCAGRIGCFRNINSKSTGTQTPYKTKDVGTTYNYKVAVSNAATQCLLKSTNTAVWGSNVTCLPESLERVAQLVAEFSDLTYMAYACVNGTASHLEITRTSWLNVPKIGFTPAKFVIGADGLGQLQVLFHDTEEQLYLDEHRLLDLEKIRGELEKLSYDFRGMWCPGIENYSRASSERTRIFVRNYPWLHHHSNCCEGIYSLRDKKICIAVRDLERGIFPCQKCRALKNTLTYRASHPVSSAQKRMRASPSSRTPFNALSPKEKRARFTTVVHERKALAAKVKRLESRLKEKEEEHLVNNKKPD